MTSLETAAGPFPRFIEHRESVIFFGPAGVGKTHLASAALERIVHYAHIITITGKSYRARGLSPKKREEKEVVKKR